MTQLYTHPHTHSFLYSFPYGFSQDIEYSSQCYTGGPYCLSIFFFFPFIFISWRLITLQYCSGFCHMLT